MTEAMTLTDTQLAEIRERADKATPGRWVAYGEGGGDFEILCFAGERDENGISVLVAGDVGAQCRVNSEFVAHARADVPDLLSHIASLESQLSTIRKEATDAERERCAGIAERDSPRECPYTCDKKGDATWTHTDDDACPVCRCDGEGSLNRCVGVAKNRIAQAIRAPTGDEGK